VQFNTLFRWIPLSVRFFAGTLAVVIAGVLLVAGITVIGYEKSQVLQRSIDRDFEVLQSLSGASAALAWVHIDVQNLLEDAGEAYDEEAVYIRGSDIFTEIDGVIENLRKALDADSALPPQLRSSMSHHDPQEILGLVRTYRNAIVTAVEMTSVDLKLAWTELARATEAFNWMAATTTGFINHFQDHIDEKFHSTVADAERAIMGWGIPGGLIVGAVLLFSWLMAKRLTEDLGQILTSMRRLGAGNTDVGIPDIRGDPDLAPIVEAVGVFRSALIDLRQSQAVLEAKVRKRTKSLRKAVANLELEVARRTETERQLTMVLESMDQGIYAVGPDLTISLINRRFADLYGLPPELRRPGAKFEDLAQFNAERGCFGTGEVEEHVEERLKLARESRPLAYEITLPDGRVVDTRSNPLPGGGFVRTATDITERKEIEYQLRQAQKMQSLGNLAGGLAHEINNLLLPILALAKMTRKQFPEDSRDAKRLEKIVEASERAKALVAQVMAFGRQDEPKMENVDIGRIVRETMELLYKTLLSTITIRKHLDEATGNVWADAAQIGAVVINLVNNAQDSFDGKSGTIDVMLGPIDVNDELTKTVQGLRTGPYAKLTVADCGKGMDDETLRRVFDPFFTTKEVGTGKGLGMSMVYGIVKRHDGAINLASKPGVGTTVDIYLPLVQEKTA